MDEETKALKIEEYNQENAELDDILILDLEDIYELDGESTRNDELLYYLSRSESAETSTVIRDLSVTIAHFIFRNGPVERIHSGPHPIEKFMDIPSDTPLRDISQLTEIDMEILNKFMVDRIGYLLTLYQKAEYTKLRIVLDAFERPGFNWDSPDIEKVEKEVSYTKEFYGKRNQIITKRKYGAYDFD